MCTPTEQFRVFPLDSSGSEYAGKIFHLGVSPRAQGSMRERAIHDVAFAKDVGISSLSPEGRGSVIAQCAVAVAPGGSVRPSLDPGKYGVKGFKFILLTRTGRTGESQAGDKIWSGSGRSFFFLARKCHRVVCSMGDADLVPYLHTGRTGRIALYTVPIVSPLTGASAACRASCYYTSLAIS